MFTLGLVVRILRETGGWQVRPFAAAAGLSPTTLTEIELGRGNPTHTTLSRLVRPFQISVSQLYELTDALDAATTDVLGPTMASSFRTIVQMPPAVEEEVQTIRKSLDGLRANLNQGVLAGVPAPQRAPRRVVGQSRTVPKSLAKKRRAK